MNTIVVFGTDQRAFSSVNTFVIIIHNTFTELLLGKSYWEFNPAVDDLVAVLISDVGTGGAGTGIMLRGEHGGIATLNGVVSIHEYDTADLILPLSASGS